MHKNAEVSERHYAWHVCLFCASEARAVLWGFSSPALERNGPFLHPFHDRNALYINSISSGYSVVHDGNTAARARGSTSHSLATPRHANLSLLQRTARRIKQKPVLPFIQDGQAL